MDLPEHMRPSSDARIATWVGAFALLTLAAVSINRRRRA